MPRQLLWRTLEREKECWAPRTLRAPSWSWAALDIPVGYPWQLGWLEESHIHIYHDETICVPWISGDQTSEIEGGKLTVQGQLAPVQLYLPTEGNDATVRERDGHKRCITIDVNNYEDFGLTDVNKPATRAEPPWLIVGTENRGEFDPYTLSWSAVGTENCDEFDPNTLNWSEARFWCLQVATYTTTAATTNVYGPPLPLCMFLVLERRTAKTGGWRRVGMGSEPELDSCISLFADAEEYKISIV